MHSHYNRHVAISQWFDNKYANAFTLYSYVFTLCTLRFFKYKTHIYGSSKTLDFSVRIKIDNDQKPNYIYIYIIFIVYG